jgi:pyruvoyl-dependent arginine decarboxylase (PvlArgDC)
VRFVPRKLTSVEMALRKAGIAHVNIVVAAAVLL